MAWVYRVDWLSYENQADAAPDLENTLQNVTDMKKIVGHNLFLKDDNSLWTFTYLPGEQGEFPIDAETLNWYKIYDDVAYASSSADGNIIAIKDGNGELFVLRNSLN